jgi:D-3-phosphoglycerate dehydrogenase
VMRLFIAEGHDFSNAVLHKLRSKMEVDVGSCDQKEIKQILERYDVFWFRLGFTIGANEFSDKTKCRYIVSPVTGIDHIDEQACKQKGIQIICLRGESEFLKNIKATGEHTILLTLMLLRHGAQAYSSVKNGQWDRDLFRGNEISGKTVGIIGVGRLGSLTANLFSAFGAHVIGWDHRDDYPYHIAKRMASLQELAAQADIVSVHLSYTSQTHQLISSDFFKAMKPGSYFINTSRGGIVDEPALIQALQNKTLTGAAVDVIQGEHGSVQSNPLVMYASRENNLIITPHIGGNIFESFEKTENFIADKLLAAISKA